MMTRALIFQQFGASEGQHRPQPLAATGDQMAGQFRNQRDFGLHPFQNDAVDGVHVIGDQRHHGFTRRRRAAIQVMNGGSHMWGDVAMPEEYGKQNSLMAGSILATS